MSATPLERISWDVYCPFPRVRAQAEFTFAEKSRRSGSRYPKLRGSGYTAKRYAEAVDVVSLDLGTDDYLVLKHRDYDYAKGGAGKVVRSYPHLRRFVEGLHEALEMVRDECFEEAENGAYQLTEKGYDASIHVPDLFGGASVAFEPVICEVVVDDDVAVFGSSNMDMRSFSLNMEVSVMLVGGESVDALTQVVQQYREVSEELTLEQWLARPRSHRWLDNVFRLTSALQ